MNIIDAHTHIGKWSSIFFNYESTVEQAIDVMKSSGIHSAVCIPADATSNSELFNKTVNNREFKFYFSAWIRPTDNELDEFLRLKLKDISFFKFHPSIDGIKISDEKFKKYIELASEHRIPIIVHCGRWVEVSGFRIPADLSVQYPETNFILAHLGGDQPSLYLECANYVRDKRLKNVYLGTESVREFYFVNHVVKTVGAERVIFGSDYNLGLPKMYIPIIESLDVPLSDKELIFSGNILRIMEKDV